MSYPLPLAYGLKPTWVNDKVLADGRAPKLQPNAADATIPARSCSLIQAPGSRRLWSPVRSGRTVICHRAKDLFCQFVYEFDIEARRRRHACRSVQVQDLVKANLSGRRFAKRKTPRRFRRGVLFKILAVTYSHLAYGQTTMGAERFHFRVRNGIGWFPPAMTARKAAAWVIIRAAVSCSGMILRAQDDAAPAACRPAVRAEGRRRRASARRPSSIPGLFGACSSSACSQTARPSSMRRPACRSRR